MATAVVFGHPLQYNRMAEKQEQPPVAQNGEKAENAENAEESAEGEKPKEVEELPPFEIVTG